MFKRDAERAGQLARTVAGAFHRADQNAPGNALRLGDDIQTVMNTVIEEDVGVAGRAEQHFGPAGPPAPGMGGFIAEGKIRLDFENPPAMAAEQKTLAQQPPGDLHGRPGIEGAWQDHVATLVKVSRLMRLFIGLDVPYEMRRNLELLLHHLKPHAKISWSPMSNLHLTTKFIGEWPEERLDELKGALRQVPAPGDLHISIRGIGWFPNPHHPRVLYAGVAAPDGFATLARDTERACGKLGVPAEEREFRPHLTLARIKAPTDLTALRQTIANLPSADFGSFTASEFHLYESRLAPGGSIYTKLASYSLSAC